MAIPTEVEELCRIHHVLTVSKPLFGRESEHDEAARFLTEELHKVRPELGGCGTNIFKLEP